MAATAAARSVPGPLTTDASSPRASTVRLASAGRLNANCTAALCIAYQRLSPSCGISTISTVSSSAAGTRRTSAGTGPVDVWTVNAGVGPGMEPSSRGGATHTDERRSSGVEPHHIQHRAHRLGRRRITAARRADQNGHHQQRAKQNWSTVRRPMTGASPPVHPTPGSAPISIHRARLCLQVPPLTATPQGNAPTSSRGPP